MIAIEVKVKAAGLMMIPLPSSMASCTQSMISYSRFDCRKTIGWPPAASRHIASTSARVVRP